jgi:hypothetical protein
MDSPIRVYSLPAFAGMTEAINSWTFGVPILLLFFFEFSDFLHEDFRKIGNCLTSETRSFFDLGNQVGKKIENEKTKRRTFWYFSVMKSTVS